MVRWLNGWMVRWLEGFYLKFYFYFLTIVTKSKTSVLRLRINLEKRDTAVSDGMVEFYINECAILLTVSKWFH
jgi:hypothetical protein